jgi:hypothetical protein
MFIFFFLQEEKLKILKFNYSWAEEVEKHERMMEVPIQHIPVVFVFFFRLFNLAHSGKIKK